MPGVGAGDVAHGALILEVSLEIRAPSGCCGVDSDSLAGRDGLYGRGLFRLLVPG